MQPIRIGVLASGGGTNFQSIIDSCANGSISGSIAVLITNKAECGAIARAQKAGITVEVINHRDYPDRESFDREMIARLDRYGIDLVALAGFMRILSPIFVEHFAGRLMNIHPALLPAFPGLHVQQAAIEHGARFSGCTVHFVDAGMDTGPIIIQAVVPVLQDDTADTLAARILVEEHKIYPRAIKLFAEKRLKIDGRRVLVDPAGPSATGALHNPSLQG